MSFRWYIYYSAMIAGCAAFAGWAIGGLASGQQHILRAGFKGLFLGMAVAFSLALLDALWNATSRHLGMITLRLLCGLGVGAFGGFLGGVVGQVFYSLTQWSAFLLAGWTLTGLLIGCAPGTFDLLYGLAGGSKDAGSPRRKLINGVIGGSLGGMIGGWCFLALQSVWGGYLQDRMEDFWSPGATGFVVLGLCIGLLIGLAQVILKEAWLRVESGFRAGREMLIGKGEIVIGRAESCEVGLFGDPTVEKQHARIRRDGQRDLVEDLGTPAGTFVNDQRIDRPTPLFRGDRIRVGRNVIRFGDRRSRPQPAPA